jgi:hypothetical protein
MNKKISFVCFINTNWRVEYVRPIFLRKVWEGSTLSRDDGLISLEYINNITVLKWRLVRKA